jgi:hypothetical protein
MEKLSEQLLIGRSHHSMVFLNDSFYVLGGIYNSNYIRKCEVL